MKNIYEIHDLTTNEILVDNLHFDEVPELFKAYQNFYPNHEIAVFDRIDGYIKSSKQQEKQQFTLDWFVLLEENLCNIY